MAHVYVQVQNALGEVCYAFLTFLAIGHISLQNANISSVFSGTFHAIDHQHVDVSAPSFEAKVQLLAYGVR